MRPERLFPLILVIVVAAVFFLAYGKKTQAQTVPEAFVGHPAVELFYRHDCVTCHTVTSLPDARGNLGPGLDEVGIRALEYDPEHNGEHYLRESLLQPSKVVREGFINGMPSFQDKMSPEEVSVLVAWLSSLRGTTKSEVEGSL